MLVDISVMKGTGLYVAKGGSDNITFSFWLCAVMDEVYKYGLGPQPCFSEG